MVTLDSFKKVSPGMENQEDDSKVLEKKLKISDIVHEKREDFKKKKTRLEEARLRDKEITSAPDILDRDAAGGVLPEIPDIFKKMETDKLRKEIEVAQKHAIEGLRDENEAEIDEALSKIDVDALSEHMGVIQVDFLSAAVDVDELTSEDKKKAFEGMLDAEGKPITDVSQLSPEQVQIIQTKQTKTYIDAIAHLSEDIKKDPGKVRESLPDLEKKHPGITNFVEKQKDIALVVQENFSEAVKKDPTILAKTIKSIKENGFILTGIGPESKLGKTLTEIMKGNVKEYQEIVGLNEELVDVEALRGLKNVLGGGYADLLFSEKFLLGDDHPFKKARDVLTNTLNDEIAQIAPPENTDGVLVYQNAVKNVIVENTGVSEGVAEKVIQQAGINNLSPFVRFLANLFAPIFATLPGPVGDFWKQYLQNKDMNSNNVGLYGEEAGGRIAGSPQDGNYIENAKGADIAAAAMKYNGITESKDPDTIREMHKSGGLNDGPATAWCMSYVQHVLRKDMGYTDAQIGPKTASAIDGHRMGRHVDKKDVKEGDLVILKGSGESGRHVGFVTKVHGNGRYDYIGGNQGNAVSIRTNQSVDSALEFRGFEKRNETQESPTELIAENGSNKITQLALQWHKEGKAGIKGAVHCTDWVDRVYKQTTGRSVYDFKPDYNGVHKVPGGGSSTGIGGSHAPKEKIAQIGAGQHLIVDHGNNGGRTHSVIALGTPDSAGRVQVVSYPNGGKPPRVEWYNLGEGSGKKRVLRIQGPKGLPSSSSESKSESAPALPQTSPGDVDGQIQAIKNNESGNRQGNEGYADWNEGEDFPSMGFAHFIWTKEGSPARKEYGNSFYEMMQYITAKKGIPVPPDLDFLLNPNPPSTWKNLATMKRDPRYQVITNFLAKSDVKRAGYDYIQNSRLVSLSKNLTGKTLEKFNMLARGPKGAYILTDYVNFKGEGLDKKSTFGFRQVLERMGIPSDSADAARKFRDAAVQLLAQRSDSARWIDGWTKRLNTYV